MPYRHFFLLTPIPSNAIAGNYNFLLVMLSYVVAVFASYVALDMTGRLREDHESVFNKRLWLFGGAFAMGAGIWSMHFIGMLAYHMSIPMEFDFFYTALSMVFAIAASLIALSLLKNKNFRRMHLIWGGIILGIAIALMHYTGMEAMKAHINFSYKPGLFFLSIVIAIFAAEATLWLALHSIKGSVRQQVFSKIISAVVMGIAICGMHYTGMAATIFIPFPESHLDADYNPLWLASSIAVITLVIIGIALIVSTYKQLMSSALQKKNDELAKAQQELRILNTNLEDRVTERTHELKTLYDALEEKSLKLREALQVAESASKLKSEFLANISHELRTPLNAIIGYSEILHEDIVEDSLEDSKNYEGYLEKVLDSAHHLLDLIDDVLDLSKIEAGKMNIFLEEIRIESFLKEIKNLVKPLMAKNHNTFRLIISTQIDIIYTDLVKMKQLLLNLLSNAAKFTQNGIITLEVKSFIEDKKKWIQFSVRDTGIGIPADKISRLFQSFTQGDGSTTRKYGGTGLGLYLTKRFCEMLGGRVSVKSKEDEGSEFRVEFPLKNCSVEEKVD